MKAAVMHEPGGPEVLSIEDRPIPEPSSGEVLIRVRAFGLNRSELFTRQGHSPPDAVTLPRVLGIEACGETAACPGGEFEQGSTVVTAMGGMGRLFDGGYAEYTCVPVSQVQRVETSLAWDILGALPEMLQTAWGSLFSALQLKNGESLLVRGGTTSVGLAAAAIAKTFDATVAATSRSPSRESMLRENGADHVFIDSGEIARDVRSVFPDGVDKVLELVGTTTLADSLQCAAAGGSVCMTGMVGDSWSFTNFAPMDVIPSTVNLTIYSGGTADFMNTPLQSLLEQVERGRLAPRIGKVFPLNDIVEAHRCMEENRAGGKIVVLP